MSPKGGNYPNSAVLCHPRWELPQFHRFVSLKVGITPISPFCVTKGGNYPNSDVLWKRYILAFLTCIFNLGTYVIDWIAPSNYGVWIRAQKFIAFDATSCNFASALHKSWTKMLSIYPGNKIWNLHAGLKILNLVMIQILLCADTNTFLCIKDVSHMVIHEHFLNEPLMAVKLS